MTTKRKRARGIECHFCRRLSRGVIIENADAAHLCIRCNPPKHGSVAIHLCVDCYHLIRLGWETRQLGGGPG
jgi:hypothetical protein